MSKNQKPDVVRYAQKDQVFPFHSTTDQLYDQVQFEAYRQLGHTAAGAAFPDKLVEQGLLTRARLDEAFGRMLEEASAQMAQEPES